MYDSKLCGAAAQYKQDCGWGCKKMAKVQSSGNYNNMKKQWGGFEKFCLFFWSFAGKYKYEMGPLLCPATSYITNNHSPYIYVYNYFQNHSRRFGLGCTQATSNDVPRRCHRRGSCHEWRWSQETSRLPRCLGHHLLHFILHVHGMEEVNVDPSYGDQHWIVCPLCLLET